MACRKLQIKVLEKKSDIIDEHMSLAVTKQLPLRELIAKKKEANFKLQIRINKAVGKMRVFSSNNVNPDFNYWTDDMGATDSDSVSEEDEDEEG